MEIKKNNTIKNLTNILNKKQPQTTNRNNEII